jgi:CheY-like chemotaxis protein
VPVIAMTASVMPVERSTMVAEGFGDFLSKPFAIRELIDVVGRAVGTPS